MRRHLAVWIHLASLLCVSPVWADWLGLMENGSGSHEIDAPLDSRELDLDFDQNNNGICVITQNTSSYFRLLESRQSYGGNLWTPSAASAPIDNTTIVGSTYEPSLDIHSSGSGMCVYSQYDTANFRNRIYGDFFNLNFSIIHNSLPIDNGTAFHATQPSVAMLSDQTGILTYVQATAGGYNRVFASRWQNNAWHYWGATQWTTLGSAVPIDGPEAVNAYHPQVAVSRAGELVAVFSKEGGQKRIYAACYRNGGWYYWGIGGWVSIATPGTSVAVSLPGGGYQADHPSLAALPDGRMICTYVVTDTLDGNSRIHSTVYDGQTWTPGVPSTWVDTAANTVAASYPDVAVSPLGKVICVYAKGNTEDAIIHAYASEWDGSQWLPMNANQPLDALGNSATAMTPKIAFDSLGNAISVFQVWKPSEGTDGRARVMANYFQGPPQVTGLSPDSGNNNTRVTVTVDGFNFAGGATSGERISAWLAQPGQPDIVGENITVMTPTNNFFTARQFTVEFDLNGAPVGDWDLVVENPDGQRYVAARLFGVTWPDLERAYVYPNPIRVGGSGPQGAMALRFFNLTHTTDISIYTVDGVRVKRLSKKDRQLFVDWDLRNENGSLVAPGIYTYRLASDEGSRVKGKFMVIR